VATINGPTDSFGGTVVLAIAFLQKAESITTITVKKRTNFNLNCIIK
jgi:hypothetical protein